MRLPDDLMRAVKRFAADTDRTLTSVIEDALRAALAREAESDRLAPKSTPRVPTFGAGGVRSGVDLDDSASLRDLMDRAGREE